MILIIGIFFGINFFFKYELIQSKSIKIYDKNGILLYQTKQSNSRNSTYKNINEIPSFIKDMVIFREDKRFFNHYGIDIFGSSRALYLGIKNLNFSQGASTIDQQDIKLTQKAFKRNVGQKIKEMFLAMNINFHYSKNDILLYYINNLPFGNGIYGFQTACDIYFGKSCENLNKGELIYLFTLTKFGKKIDVSAPSFELAQKMGINNYKLDDFQKISKSLEYNISNKSPFYIDYLLDNIDINKTTGDNIQTYFDYDLYQKIDTEITNLKEHFLSKNAQDLCAIVLDSSGNIISMNQIKDFGNEKGGYINYCLTKRQVGSAIKPFLYTLAFQNNIYKPDDYITDEPISYELGDGDKYQPQNFDRGYHGKIKISQALGNSLNVPAVKTLDKVGLPNFRNFLKEIGNYTNTNEKWNEDYSRYGLSLALGSKEITPLDFAKMWTIFTKNDASPFIYKYGKNINQTKSIISDNSNRLISFGTDNWLNIPGTFAKTGTSRNFVDGWTCGGNNQYIICIWIGNYNNSQMKDSGINTAGILRNHIIQIVQK